MYVSIDPGKTGGAVLLDEEGTCLRYTLFARGKYDFFKMLDDVGDDPKIIVEDVRGYAGENVKSVFTFGKELGHIEGILISCGHKVDDIMRVNPRSWTAFFKEVFKGDRTKNKSCKAVKHLFKNKLEELNLNEVVRYDALSDAYLMWFFLKKTGRA